MSKNLESSFGDIVNRQGATALILAAVDFLSTHNIPRDLILRTIRQHYQPGGPRVGLHDYRKLARAYEEMGIVMSTWFADPRFLDRDSRPTPLSTRPGHRSIYSLVRAARVSISTRMAIGLLRRSPSIGVDLAGDFVARRREFVLPEFTVPRAAVVIERYLDTLHKNCSQSKKKPVLLLERNCHVPEVNLRTIAPVLRDIKKRGSAYIDSVNGDIEELRRKRSRGKDSGEMSVHIFAWTRLSKHSKQKRA
jgi:hypothetical protein